jgi:hypothetical protein
VNNPNVMRMFVVYRDPADYPGRYVVRGCSVGAGRIVPDSDPTFVGDDLVGARAAIPREANTRFARDENDEPQIVETWF